DAVHSHTLATPRGAELACERDDSGFRRPVVWHHRRAVDTGDGRDVDDHAADRLLHHLATGPLATEKGSGQVDPDHGVPAVDRDVLGLGAEGGAGVVDHDVEPAELLHRALDHALDLIFLAHVDGHGERAAAEIVNGLGHGPEMLELPATEGDVG